MAEADGEREEVGGVEEGVDAEDDARVADLEVLSGAGRGNRRVGIRQRGYGHDRSPGGENGCKIINAVMTGQKWTLL